MKKEAGRDAEKIGKDTEQEVAKKAKARGSFGFGNTFGAKRRRASPQMVNHTSTGRSSR